MMEEDDVSKITKELEDAALTDVTQTSPIKEASPPLVAADSNKERVSSTNIDFLKHAPPIPIETLVSSIPSANVDTFSFSHPGKVPLIPSQSSPTPSTNVPQIPCYFPATTAAPTFPGFPQPSLATPDSSPSPSPQQQPTNPYRALTGLSAHVPAPAVNMANIFVPHFTQETAQHDFQPPPGNIDYYSSYYAPDQPSFQYGTHQHHRHAGHGHSHGYGGGESFLKIPQDHGTSLDHQYQSYGSYKSDGFLGWVSNVGNKVFEKTKSSVETMITTLDPGMKAVLHSGGDIDIVVTTSSEDVVDGIRQAFQEVFGRATVNGMETRSDIAPQPVGFTAGLKGAENKIENLRRSSAVHERQTLVSVESFIHEIFTDKWFDCACLILKDPLRNIDLTVFTQAVPINPTFIQQVLELTPNDYDLRWSGSSVTIGEIINRNIPRIHPLCWHKEITGVSKQESVYGAAKVLATLYKNQCN